MDQTTQTPQTPPAVSGGAATPPPQDLKTEWIKDPATRIALITGFVSVLITLLNALLG